MVQLGQQALVEQQHAHTASHKTKATALATAPISLGCTAIKVTPRGAKAAGSWSQNAAASAVLAAREAAVSICFSKLGLFTYKRRTWIRIDCND